MFRSFKIPAWNDNINTPSCKKLSFQQEKEFAKCEVIKGETREGAGSSNGSEKDGWISYG